MPVSYTHLVYENTSGNKYALAYRTPVTVMLTNDYAPFLHANQYVNYTSNSQAVKKAAELTKGKKTSLDKINVIYEFVVCLLYTSGESNTVKFNVPSTPGYYGTVQTVGYLVNRQGQPINENGRVVSSIADAKKVTAPVDMLNTTGKTKYFDPSSDVTLSAPSTPDAVSYTHLPMLQTGAALPVLRQCESIFRLPCRSAAIRP